MKYEKTFRCSICGKVTTNVNGMGLAEMRLHIQKHYAEDAVKDGRVARLYAKCILDRIASVWVLFLMIPTLVIGHNRDFINLPVFIISMAVSIIFIVASIISGVREAREWYVSVCKG